MAKGGSRCCLPLVNWRNIHALNHARDFDHGSAALLQIADRIIMQFPDVDRVLGKAGRAGTATDPAPLSVLETVIILRPKADWRRAHTRYSSWSPEWTKPVLRHSTPDNISSEELVSD